MNSERKLTTIMAMDAVNFSKLMSEKDLDGQPLLKESDEPLSNDELFEVFNCVNGIFSSILFILLELLLYI